MSTDSVSEHRDDYGSKLGMWLFLFTEIFFFGGLFIVYAVYRSQYPLEFRAASLHLDTYIGALNTIILVTSSMCMSFATTAMQKGNRKLSARLIAITVILAGAFLTNKYFEWDHKILLNLYPGSGFMLTLSHGYVMFFGLYFFMTGLHALHIIIGMVLLTICYMRVRFGNVDKDKPMLLLNSTLYWHLVDLIWLFLFPLLYLIK